MNALSWALYAADVLERLQPLFVLTGIVAGPAAFGLIGLQRAAADRGGELPYPRRRWAALSAVLLISACLIPSPKTVYLIAASEAGERVATSPEGRDMLELVRRRLRELLSDKV